MQREEEIVDKLCDKFDFLHGNIYIQRVKRIFSLPLTAEKFEKVLQYVCEEMGFFRAHHVVGTDDGENLGFTYLVSNHDNIILALKESAPKSDPRIHTMTGIYPSLIQHERELTDLFGAVVEGLPEGPSYPLPDGWPKGNYPMRKEWKTEYFDKNTMTYNPPVPDGKKEGETNGKE
ncbi:MAG: NADH-quinone oxidoreductase subunit C [Thermoclostridium sp.]|nr:NADH-quinone oxidoreductase subunit C [Thermoclostridium sp.]